jgi:hypothetical protein
MQLIELMDDVMSEKARPADEHMSKALHALAMVRENVASAKDEYDNAMQLFVDEHAELIERRAMWQHQAETLESIVRRSAVEVYEATGDKQVHPCVSIAVTKGYDYDPAKGLAWALDHKACLTLDTKAFKDVCKAEALRPDFVAVSETPTARIATDLSALVAEAEKD